MKQKSLRLVLALVAIVPIALLAVWLAGRSRPHSRSSEVRVVSWGGKFQSDLFSRWVQPAATAAGITLLPDAWNGDYGALTTRIQRGINTADLVHVEAQYAAHKDATTLFEPLSSLRLELLSDSVRATPTVQSGRAVPVLQYAYVLAYRHASVGAPNRDLVWADFWDTNALKGRRGLRDFPIGNIEIALLAAGEDPKSTLYNPALSRGELTMAVDRALAKLSEIEPSVIWWSAGDPLERGLVSGEMAMAAAWSGRAHAAAKVLCSEARDIQDCDLRISRNTALVSTDWWIIPAGAPNSENAQRLLESMYSENMRSNAASFSVAQGYSAPVSALPIDDPFTQDYLRIGSSDNASSLELDTRFWSANFDWISEKWRIWRSTR